MSLRKMSVDYPPDAAFPIVLRADTLHEALDGGCMVTNPFVDMAVQLAIETVVPEDMQDQVVRIPSEAWMMPEAAKGALIITKNVSISATRSCETNPLCWLAAVLARVPTLLRLFAQIPNFFNAAIALWPIIQGAHFSLVVIFNPGSKVLKERVIKTMDSLSGTHHGGKTCIRVQDVLNEARAQVKMVPVSYTSCHVTVPQQKDVVNCGPFVGNLAWFVLYDYVQGTFDTTHLGKCILG